MRAASEVSREPPAMFTVADIEEARAFMKDLGVAIAEDIQRPHDGLAWLTVEDSEGNLQMLVESDLVNPAPTRQTHPEGHPLEAHINTIIVPARDLKRATEWYSRFVGQPIKPERQDGGPIYWFDMDNGTGILLDDSRNNGDFRRFPTFMLKARDIHDAHRFAKEKGIKVVRDVQFDHWFAIEDPEGNTVMVCLQYTVPTRASHACSR